MERSEERIRAARPAVPHLPPDFAAQVMAEIERQGLAIRPAWRVRAPVWLGRAACVAALAVAVLALNAAAYQFRSSGTLELLYFGTRLLGGVVSGLPYDLLLTVLLLGGAAAWLIRYARVARVPVAWAVIISYGLSGAGGLALAASGVNETVQDAVLSGAADVPGLDWFYGRRAMYHRPDPRFRMGRVIAQEGRTVRLETPLGDEETVLLPPGTQVQPGDMVRLITAPGDATLRADAVQLCRPASVQHYFHHRQMMRGRMGPGMGPGMGRGMGPGMGSGMGPGMGGPMHRGGMGGGMGPGMGGGMGPGMSGPPQR